ncbi:MAG: methyltransferase domain-containing protein [Candidatus Lokiarchaeota archaeon]|nr:methyltransferase domain-containing protein [Candidatus Lokiarchaeota archaeon]
MDKNDKFQIAEQRKEELLVLISSYVTRVFSRQLKKEDEKIEERLMRLEKFKEDVSILDLRSGRGWLLNKLFSCGYRKLFGIDVDRIRIRESNYAINTVNIDNKDSNEAIATKIMFNQDCFGYDFLRKEYFDVVIVTNMLTYIKDLKSFIQQVSALIRAGGIIIITNPNSGGSVGFKTNRNGYPIFNLEDLMNLPFSDKFILKEHYSKMLFKKYDQSFVIFEKTL